MRKAKETPFHSASTDMSSHRTPALAHNPGHASANLRIAAWLVKTGLLAGACIGLVRGVIAGPEYILAGILKGAMLGLVFAVTIGGFEQIVLRPLWRRLSLLKAVLVRTAIYAPLATVIYFAVSAAFSPWLAWSLQRQMIFPWFGIAAATLFIGSAMLGLVRLLGPRVLKNLLSGRYRSPSRRTGSFCSST